MAKIAYKENSKMYDIVISDSNIKWIKISGVLGLFFALISFFFSSVSDLSVYSSITIVFSKIIL